MEEEKVKEEIPRKKRRVSLFRRRKRSPIRPFVKERKQREYKKLLFYFFLFLAFIIALAIILYGIRMYIIERIFVENEKIISPQSGIIIDNPQIKAIIEGQDLAVSDIIFATDSGVVRFRLNKETEVYLSTKKDIKREMELIEAIDRQVTADGKQAITIDLRYNKPIVKF